MLPESIFQTLLELFQSSDQFGVMSTLLGSVFHSTTFLRVENLIKTLDRTPQHSDKRSQTLKTAPGPVWQDSAQLKAELLVSNAQVSYPKINRNSLQALQERGCEQCLLLFWWFLPCHKLPHGAMMHLMGKALSVPGRTGSSRADWSALITLIQIITHHPVLQRAVLDMLCCTGTLSFIQSTFSPSLRL